MRQRHVEVVVAAEGVAPGQPVQQLEPVVVQEGPDLGHLLLVGRQHGVRVDHRLGAAGGAAGHQVLGVRVRAHGLVGAHHRWRLARVQQALQGQGACALLGVLAEDDRPRRGVRARLPAGDGRRVDGRIAGVDQRRVQRVQHRVQLAVVAGHAAVGAGDRAHRAPDVHGGQRQQRVVDGVVAEHDDRPAGGQLHVQQCLRQAPDDLACLRVTQAPPRTRARALGQEERIGRRRGPVLEPGADAACVRLQRLGVAQHEAAARQVLALDARNGQRAEVAEEQRPRRPLARTVLGCSGCRVGARVRRAARCGRWRAGVHCGDSSSMRHRRVLASALAAVRLGIGSIIVRGAVPGCCSACSARALQGEDALASARLTTSGSAHPRPESSSAAGRRSTGPGDTGQSSPRRASVRPPCDTVTRG